MAVILFTNNAFEAFSGFVLPRKLNLCFMPHPSPPHSPLKKKVASFIYPFYICILRKAF